MARRCGFLSEQERGERRVVWVRKQNSSEECPRSLISAESTGWVEEFLIRDRMGFGDVTDLDVRTAEAFVILHGEMERERTDASSHD